MSARGASPVEGDAEELFTRLRALVVDRTLERDPLNVMTALCMNKCVRFHSHSWSPMRRSLGRASSASPWPWPRPFSSFPFSSPSPLLPPLPLQVRVSGELLSPEQQTCLTNCADRFMELHEHVLKRYAAQMQLSLKRLSPEAQALVQHSLRTRLPVQRPLSTSLGTPSSPKS